MKTKTMIGIVFILAALLRLCRMWNLFSLDWFERLSEQPWTAYILPALLVYVGMHLIVDSFRCDPDQWLRRTLPLGEEGKRICCAVRYGGDEYVYRGEPFHGARLDAFCGGIRLDLREAVITEDEEIDIRTFMGGIELIVPPMVNVVVKSRSFIGGVGNEAARVAGSGVPCLHIVASNFLGGVSIKNS